MTSSALGHPVLMSHFVDLLISRHPASATPLVQTLWTVIAVVEVVLTSAFSFVLSYIPRSRGLKSLFILEKITWVNCRDVDNRRF